MKKSVTICVLGDICPTEDTRVFIESGQSKKVLGDIQNLIYQSDFSLCNVEFPITNVGKPAKKTGPVLHGVAESIQFFNNAGFSLLSLANNHIKDYGEEGVIATLDSATRLDIPTVGAGLNITEAKQGYTKEVNGLKIGVMAFAEQEFNTASENSPGSNFLDLYTDFESLKTFKEKVDFLIVLFHGGIEYYEYPSPLLQKKCRKLVECGADFVTCQHSHIIGTRESYLAGEILYGQGNSVFGYREGSNFWNQGLLVNIEVDRNDNKIVSTFDYVPISANNRGGIERMSERKSKILLREFDKRSLQLTDADFIQSEWINFCNKQENLVIPQLLGYNKWLIRLNRLTKGLIIKLFYSSKKKMVTQNLIRCEAHNEVIKTLLDNKS